MSDPVDKLRNMIGTIQKQEDEITRLQERLAQYEAARCIRCGCPIGAYHPADAKRITDRQEKTNRLWEENVRRREAIEKHKEAMIAENIASYYFDRELWSVLEAQK